MNFHLASFEASFGLFSQLPPSDHLEIAFAGRSNVGKSSLINKLLNRRNLARVSSVPGKTATINFYTLEDIRIVDLPGYGYAKVSKSEKARWAGLMEGYFADDRRLGLVVQLVDMRHAPTRDDLQMINFLIDNEFPFVIVLTKRDKLSARQQQERLKELAKELPYFEQLTILPISSTSGEGMQELREIIEEVAQSEREA